MLGSDVDAPSTPGEHRMDWSAYLELKLGQLFPESTQRATAEAELGRYGMGDHEPEAERVHLAILKLSGGDLERAVASGNLSKEAAMEAMFRMTPPPCSSMTGITALQQLNTPFTLTSNIL